MVNGRSSWWQCLAELRSSSELARFCGHPNLLTFLDEQRHADLDAGLKLGRFGHTTAGGIAACARFRVRDVKFNVGWQLNADRIAIELVELNDRAFDQEVEGVADHVIRESERLECVLIHEV